MPAQRLRLIPALLLAIGLSGEALALPEVGALELSLSDIEQRIRSDEEVLRAALAGHDPEAIRAAGAELRALKVRRAQLERDLEAAKTLERQRVAGELLWKRPHIARRLTEVEPAVDAAATAFDAEPTGRRGSRLRTLSLEEAGLKGDLKTADEAARDPLQKPKPQPIPETP